MADQTTVSNTNAANGGASSENGERTKPKYPGIRLTCNGNQLVTQYVETRITEGGLFYPITPSTEGGELYQQSFAQGELNVFGQQKIAIECEGEHAAQGGAKEPTRLERRVALRVAGAVTARQRRARCSGGPTE